MKNNEEQHAAYWITHLKMTPHPEGGYYREVYRAEEWTSMEGWEARRRVMTTIHYLLEKNDFSAFHRI